MARLGDFCKIKDECTFVVDDSECRSGVCACRDGLQEVGGACTEEVTTDGAGGGAAAGSAGTTMTSSGGSKGLSESGLTSISVTPAMGAESGDTSGTEQSSNAASSSSGQAGTTSGYGQTTNSASSASGTSEPGAASNSGQGTTSGPSAGDGATATSSSGLTNVASSSISEADASSTFDPRTTSASSVGGADSTSRPGLTSSDASSSAGSEASSAAGGAAETTRDRGLATSSASPVIGGADTTSDPGLASTRSTSGLDAVGNAGSSEPVGLRGGGPKSTTDQMRSVCQEGFVVVGLFMPAGPVFNNPSQMYCKRLLDPNTGEQVVLNGRKQLKNLNSDGQMHQCPSNPPSEVITAIYSSRENTFHVDALLCVDVGWSLGTCRNEVPGTALVPGVSGPCSRPDHVMVGAKIKRNAPGEVEELRCCARSDP
ncbi:secreted protein C-like [Pollicipes pollicipes]|uniref:secreted protein C-like n=1 Tax=Pollicipes pollicipes TaxID=41117 RepID=UPI00188513BE|nr:secreted protein C-like [Pollicipes pollicipes]